MDLGLKDRVAIVTGGSQGIGFACAADLLKEGASVIVASKDQRRNADACERLGLLGGNGRVLGIPVDLGQPADVALLFEKTMAEFGRLDILVNSAALVASEDFFTAGDANWTSMFEHKLNGTARCIRHAVPLMRAKNWGRIVNVTGVAARQPNVKTISVALNNGAILSLTKAVAKSVAADGILVNAIVPGLAFSERNAEVFGSAAARQGVTTSEIVAERAASIPLRRLGTVEEISAVVTFLASERASFVTGSAWSVDGGVEATL